MNAKSIRFATALLCAAAAWTQTAAGQSVSQVFHFTYSQTAIDIQQITNAIRTVGEITQATLDMGAKTLTVTGTTAQLAMVSWMFTTMDQPAPANQATQQYLPAGTVDDVVRILYLSHQQTAQSFQEFVNSVRTIPQMTRVFPLFVAKRDSDARNQLVRSRWPNGCSTSWTFPLACSRPKTRRRINTRLRAPLTTRCRYYSLLTFGAFRACSRSPIRCA